MYSSVMDARKDGWKVMVTHYRRNTKGQLLFHKDIDRNELIPKGGRTILLLSKGGREVTLDYHFSDTVNYNKKIGAKEALRGLTACFSLSSH